MYRESMRIILILVICIFSVIKGFTQVKSDYFMRTSYLRNSLNPALIPDQGYLIVPVLPNIYANAQTNTINLDHLSFRGTEGRRVTFMHQSINTDDFLSGLSNNNYVNVDANIKLFALGMYRGDSFWNFDFGIRTHVDLNIPKPFFGLLKEGFDQNEQTRYDLSDLGATGNSFIELGVAHSRPFLDRSLTVGVRAKLLGGIGDFDLDAKSLTIDAGPDYWTARSKVSLRASAPGIKQRYDSEGYIDGFDFGSKFTVPGIGFGLDIGAVYDFKNINPSLKGLKVSGALNDLGFIAWTKNNTVNLHSSETDVTVTPHDYNIFRDDDASLSDVFEKAFDDIKKAVNLEGEKEKGRVSKLRMNMNLGVEYEIWERKFSVGALYSIRFGNYKNISEYTMSLNYRPCSWLAATTSYSFSHSNLDTFGIALHLAPSKGVSFFFASDYIIPHVSSQFIPTTSRALNLQVGMSIPLGKKRY